MVPIAAVVALALGGDLMLAAGLSVGAITVGFGLSPVNPYTVGMGNSIAELPLFEGAGLRTVLCFLGLTLMAWYNVRYFRFIMENPDESLTADLNTDGLQLSKPLHEYGVSMNNVLVALVFLVGIGFMLYGIFNFEWKFPEIAAIFLMVAVGAGIVNRMPARTFSAVSYTHLTLPTIA